ncbi:MAG: hypothetical protein ABSD59_08800 [Terracidiphilus sp.]|jgi:hypothetical protein
MIGRALGIGVRVAGRVAGQRLAAQVQLAAAAPQVHQAASVADSGERNRAAAVQTASRATIQAGQSVNRGVGGFLRPFRRVGGILWLEVTGVFFLIFVPVFVWRGIWPARASYAHGPNHWRFLVFTGLALVFLYLGISSFWRAHRRSQRN